MAPVDRTSIDEREAPTAKPAPWRYSPKDTAIRLFFTCWLVFVLHVATNTVREIYLALSIGDHLSFRVDEYAGMHPDLFEKPGYGWHIGANPGASMLAAVPYAISRPLVDRIVEEVNRRRAESGAIEPPSYHSWPMAAEFYQEAWRRGFDIKFGLAAIIMQSACMAPISAAAVVVMFFLFRRLLNSDRTAFWLSLLYAFGTPVFFRTGYLNHNLILGHFALFGFLAMWNPHEKQNWTQSTRYLLGGLAGGAAVLLDYSGVVLLLGLFGYGVLRNWGSRGRVVRLGAWYVLGSIGPIALLWFYQWRSFGNPFLPGQHWMPSVEWVGEGYRGFTIPQWELLSSLLMDYRYGLFISCPLMLLALAAPFVNRGRRKVLPPLELGTCLAFSVLLWIFCGGISYTRLQFNTGIRYLAPLFPFMFLLVAIVLAGMPRRVAYFFGVVSVTQAWAMAMYRDVEFGPGVLEPIARLFLGGFHLPITTRLSQMDAYAKYFEHGPSPLPLFAFVAALICGIWMWPRNKGTSTRSSAR